MPNRISLGDDGTMDTVLVCDECGQEFRGTYAAYDTEAPAACDTHGKENCEPCDRQAYDAYVDDFIAEVEAEHVCGDEE